MDTPNPSPATVADSVSQPDRVFPTLTPAQIARVAAHGRRRSTAAGEVLVEPGDKAVPFFVAIATPRICSTRFR